MPQAALAAVSRLTDALSRATTLQDVYDAALDALQQGLGVPRAAILLFNENDVMSFVAWRGISDYYRTNVNGHTPWKPDTPAPQPIVVSDVRDDESLSVYDTVFASEGIRALGFFPLVYRDRVIGKFMLYYAEPHTFRDLEVQLASTIAGQIAFGVARVRAELALQRERDRLDDLIANVPGVVWETTGNGASRRVSFVSPRIVELLGYPLESWYADPNFWETVIVERPAEENASANHYRMRTADGRLIWTEVRTARGQDGERTVIRGVTMDVTAQQEAERARDFLNEASAILASSLDYTTTLKNIAQLVVGHVCDWCSIDVRDEEGTYRRVAVTHRDPNMAAMAEQMANVTVGQQRSGTIARVIESGDPLLIAEVDWDQYGKLYADAPEIVKTMRTLGMRSYMTVPLLAGGRSFGAVSLVTGARVFDENDLALATELGRRAGYAIDNARLYQQAQDANRAKDEFLATLSHELRTPLTATLGWASMLRTQNLSAENFRLAIETIERSTRAQAKLIDDILDVSRIVAGKLTLTLAPVDLRTIIEAAVDGIRPSLATNLDLQLSLDGARAVAQGDAARLQQVIWNLLSNAVRFTPAGGSVHVILDAPESDHARVVVRDNGIGISRRLLPYVFERFRQAEGGTTRAHGGLGLGLAIVKSIVELHGGSVIAESEGEGKGATFTLRLPATTAQVPVQASTETSSAALALSGVSVLLVEDEDDTRYMLSAALQSFGARVTAVRSAAAAMHVLQSNTPTVVVSDIGMPGEDGYTFMMRIRSGAIERVRSIPAIALTAYARPEDRERILDSGFGYYLAKPIDPLQVVKTVREAAGK
ncbi:MAG TPA: ATP-binding protein [Thermoanaerobaculia bacterium]|nr:ATP-binding protein [Thermoanaerobaculia bacterium]